MATFFGRFRQLVDTGMVRVERDYHGLSAELYDEIACHTDDIDFYVGLAGKCGSSVLELGCGTGRVLIPLARAGFEVWGIDNSEPMLKILSRKLEAEPKAVAQRVHTVISDMCDFAVNRRFALALMPYFTFAHLTDTNSRKATLRNVWLHLAAGGKFAAEISLRGDRTTPSAHPVLSSVSHNKVEGSLTLVLSQQQRAHDGTIVLNLLHVFVDRHGSANLSAVSAQEAETNARELHELLTESGFKHIQFFGDFNRSQLEPDAKRTVVIATKA